MTRDVISSGPATGSAVMANLNSHVSRLWDASALPLTSVGGTANAITASLTPPLLAGLVTGMKFTLTWAATNTGNVTLSINGATAQPVLSASGAALTGGALVSGTRALIEWVGTAFRVLVGAADGPAAGPYRVTFTASGAWTVPTGYDANARVLIRAWGGGGGGSVSGSLGAGGGGGAYVERHLRFADLAASYTVTIGAGGTGGASASAGGNTTVGALITAYGGAAGLISPAGGGGGGATSAGASTQGGRPGGGTGGSSGAAGGDASTIWGGGGGGGTLEGGRAVWGGGGGGGSSGAAGISLYGGNGGAANNAGVAPGGGGGRNAAGARGEVRIEIGG